MCREWKQRLAAVKSWTEQVSLTSVCRASVERKMENAEWSELITESFEQEEEISVAPLTYCDPVSLFLGNMQSSYNKLLNIKRVMNWKI